MVKALGLTNQLQKKNINQLQNQTETQQKQMKQTQNNPNENKHCTMYLNHQAPIAVGGYQQAAETNSITLLVKCRTRTSVSILLLVSLIFWSLSAI